MQCKFAQKLLNSNIIPRCEHSLVQEIYFIFFSFFLSFSLSPFFRFDRFLWSIFRHRCTKTLFLSLPPPHLVRILLSTNSGCSEQSCTCLEDSQNYSRYHVRCNHVTQLPTKRFCSFSVFLVPRHCGGERRVELLAPAPQEINFFVSLSDRPLTPPFFYIFFYEKEEIERLMINRHEMNILKYTFTLREYLEYLYTIYIVILINEIN